MIKKRSAGCLGLGALPAVALALLWVGLAESPPDRDPPRDVLRSLAA